MLQQWQLMSSNGRDVADLSREELEDILMEIHEELEMRKQTAHDLHATVTQLNTKVQVVQSSVQDANLRYIKQPKALRPSTPYKALKKSTSLMGSPTKENFEMQVVGSFNPYEAGTRRITTLQHKLGDLKQEILDITAETKNLQAEKMRLARSLEGREVPKKEVFKHEKPIPKHIIPEAPSIDARKCMKALEGLIDKEEDPDEKDVLLCCHMLLTGHDKKALELFSVLYNSDERQEDCNTLQDALVDREAHVTILLQQFKNLMSRHKALKEAYVDVRRRLKDHVIDKDDVIFNLKHQINDIQDRLKQVPTIAEETKKLESRRTELEKEIEELQMKNETVAVEVGIKKKEVDMKRDIAGKKVLLQQLEALNDQWKEKHEEKNSRANAMKDEIEEMQAKYDELAGQKNVLQEKTNLLTRSKLRTAEQVKEIYEMSKSTSPEDLHIERQTLNNECKKKEKDMKDLKHECKVLNTSLQDKTQQIQSLQARIKNIKVVIDDNKKRAEQENEV